MTGNSYKFVTLNDKTPESVAMHPNSTFKFILRKNWISISFLKNNNKSEKLNIDINSINYPKSSLRSMNKIIKEYFSTEKFKEDAQEQLEKIKIEPTKMLKIREGQKQLLINRDILANKSKHQNSLTIHMTEFKKTLLSTYMLLSKQITGMVGIMLL